MQNYSTCDRDFPDRPSFHLSLLLWLHSQRILLFQFHYLIMVLDEVDEVNELPLKLQIGFKKYFQKRLSVQYLFQGL